MGDVRSEQRRRLLRFLAASPVVAGMSIADWFELDAQEPAGMPREPGAIESADQALDVFDFEAVAHQKLPPAHFGYLATGVDADATLRANRAALSRIEIRARHLTDVTRIDTATELFGVRWETPIVLAPMGSQRAFHPDAELAVARAARAKRHLQILSTVSTTSVEDVAAARGEPIWYQLYPTSDWAVTEGLLARAEKAGCPAIVLTVDLPVGTNRETLLRSRRVDSRDCQVCHQPGFAGMVSRKPMFDGLDVTRVEDLVHPGMTWDFVKRLRDRTRAKLLIKGIVTAEDAALCATSGVDGIIVSNHGGRSEESGRATVDSLPEVVAAVRDRLPVLVDSGFRRGTDIFKALALGARAICIGRPYGWGLGAFGQAGVEAVLQLLRAELETAMRTCGTPSIKDITPRSVVVGR